MPINKLKKYAHASYPSIYWVGYIYIRRKTTLKTYGYFTELNSVYGIVGVETGDLKSNWP
jgi:hypothetical protein